jgi:hypothetical protein
MNERSRNLYENKGPLDSFPPGSETILLAAL